MYCLFIFLVPVAVKSVSARRSVVMLACSAVVWLAGQFDLKDRLEIAASRYLPVDFGAFNILAWQWIFVLGVILGAGGGLRIRFRPVTRNVVWFGCAVVASMLFLIRHRFCPEGGYVYQIESLGSAISLGPVRIFNFLIIAFMIATAPDWPVGNPGVRALAFLGRYSLQVFTFHLFVVYLFYGTLFNSMLAEPGKILCVASLFLAAWIYQRVSRGLKTVPNGSKAGRA
ncbi:MAG TPA: OpgC domain-containing protein, partial [Verrucomicrobiae bacterium]|nr:OpgC domain-containing protein [Verrucomicrobiae bacterium]